MKPDTPFRKGAGPLRAAAQAATVLGIIMVGLIWASLSYHLSVERSAAESAAVQNSTNLARAFGEHVSSSLSDIDRSLKVMRRSYMLYPDGFDFGDWIHGSLLADDLILQLSVIGADGYLKQSSIESQSQSRIDLRDREHFRAHLDLKKDELFISKPVLGRASGKWSVQLSRRMSNADGSFGGVMVASIDPDTSGGCSPRSISAPRVSSVSLEPTGSCAPSGDAAPVGSAWTCRGRPCSSTIARARKAGSMCRAR